MTMARHPKSSKAVSTGFWLAILAVAGQVLLPFLLAFEIALLAPVIGSDYDTPICSALHADATPSTPGSGGTEHHAPLAGCPICQAAAAGQAFTQPNAVPLAVPIFWTAVSRCSAASQRPALTVAAAPYWSRAPPSSV